MRYALDTNTIIRLLRKEPNTRRKLGDAVGRDCEIAVPPLVHFEIRRGFLCKPAPGKEESYNILIKRHLVGEMSAVVLERGAMVYANLYKAGYTVDDTDLLIAAFCLEGEYTLVTNNTRHFEVIEGLKIEDWAKEQPKE
jgi:tRNA(fMet)-specific endonuclease VapC